MNEIICYIYLTFAAALAAQGEIDKAYGIPVSDTAVTRHWDAVWQAERIEGDTVWYIRYDPSYEPILGQPDTMYTAPEAEAVKVNPIND